MFFLFIFKDVEFNNGCRAPPWRQINGDITYLIIEPFNQDTLTVTCNRSGIYLNNVRHKSFNNITLIHLIDFFNITFLKKITSLEAESFERVGNAYKDLFSLLKEKSSVFKQNIEKKVTIIN